MWFNADGTDICKLRRISLQQAANCAGRGYVKEISRVMGGAVSMKTCVRVSSKMVAMGSALVTLERDR